MLRSKEEIVVLVKQSPMKGDESLPLFITQLGCRRALLLVDLNAFFLDHDQASVDAWRILSNQIKNEGQVNKPFTSFTSCS